jgi:hypothetical protein
MVPRLRMRRGMLGRRDRPGQLSRQKRYAWTVSVYQTNPMSRYRTRRRPNDPPEHRTNRTPTLCSAVSLADRTGPLCNRPHPTLLGLAASLVEGGATGRASLWQGLERRRLSVALMWFSLSVGATGRLVRPAYRTPFGVDKPTIQGRATAARTARHLWTHSTNWQ